jgi:porin
MKYVSLANLAPGLLPFFNNGPVFGIPGTVTGDIWSRIQLTGDWGGVRTDWARHGVFIDIYSTSYCQNVTSGGLKTGDTFVWNTQASLNIDTGRAGLWPGGLLQLTLQSGFGDTPANTFTAGATLPQYTALVFPAPLRANDVLPAQFVLTLSLTKEVGVLLGKVAVDSEDPILRSSHQTPRRKRWRTRYQIKGDCRNGLKPDGVTLKSALAAFPRIHRGTRR